MKRTDMQNHIVAYAATNYPEAALARDACVKTTPVDVLLTWQSGNMQAHKAYCEPVTPEQLADDAQALAAQGVDAVFWLADAANTPDNRASCRQADCSYFVENADETGFVTETIQIVGVRKHALTVMAANAVDAPRITDMVYYYVDQQGVMQTVKHSEHPEQFDALLNKNVLQGMNRRASCNKQVNAN